jgi:hypothetical protein
MSWWQIPFVFAAVVWVVWVLVARARRTPHPWKLIVETQADWSTLDAPAPVVPRLLFTPHVASSTVRCYDARLHGPSGQRVSIGMFEAPDGLDAIGFVSARLLRDEEQIEQSNTQSISIGTMSGVGRTGWIRSVNPDGTDTGHAHIAFLFPEHETGRVHFACTIVPIDDGHAAAAHMQALLRGARFGADDGATRAKVALEDVARG